MTNAALFIHTDAYDTTGPKLMGRHSAGESFLRGYLRHTTADRCFFYNAGGQPQDDLEAMVARIQSPSQPVTWIGQRNLSALAEPGCLYYPAPDLPNQAWMRAPFGDERYSLCGITHTTASQAVMDIVSAMVTAPVQPWDGLICTSRAVRTSVETQTEAVREHLGQRLGATQFPAPQLTTIPLGVNAADFEPRPEHRRSWRQQLNIPAEAVVVLHVGRLNSTAKMNPAMMAMTLETVARETGKEIYWVVAGWGVSESYTEQHHALTRHFCPSVQYRSVDGRPAETRFSIWSVADLFLSLSDNIQETFGLTPIEAMAAGLPCVVTDWDGYRDTVRHGVDGFRIPTLAPRPGVGRDLAFLHANGWIRYEEYLAAAAQMTSIDYRDAVEAVKALVLDKELRQRMGAAGRQAVGETFEWARVIPRYEAFWGELAERRKKAAPSQRGRSDNPSRLDPFHLFASYPTAQLDGTAMFGAASGLSWDVARSRLLQPFATVGGFALPRLEDAERVFAYVQNRGQASTAEILALFPTQRQALIERSLLWLAKFEVLVVLTSAASPENLAN